MIICSEVGNLLSCRALAAAIICILPAVADGTKLSNLTLNVDLLRTNQAELLKNFCPSGAQKCNEDPAKTLDISTIGGILFVMCVGLAVGTDVTMDSIKVVMKHSKRGFLVGMIAQFGFMPLYAFALSYIFKSDLTASAFYSYEACVLGMTIVGCLPGGNTSNLFTWFSGGNVSLSILMSLVSNVAAIGMLPLMLFIYYKLRFEDAEDVPDVPFVELLAPLAATIIFVVVGMLIKAKAQVETIWWTAKISSVVALIFLVLAVLIGIRKNPHIITHPSYSMYVFCLTMQPAGYLAGWGLATIARCSLKDKMTIAFETGVQSFTLGLVMAQLGFNAEQEVCQFDSRCLSLIDGSSTKKYEFAWDGDGRIKEGDKVGQISLKGFLPGHAGQRSTGGCCRFNELVYSDVFKFSALCSLFYVLHAFWMVKLFRKVFPRGFVRSGDNFVAEQWEPTYRRQRVVLAEDRLEPAFAPGGFGSKEETPPVTVIDLLKSAASRCGDEWALGQEWPVEPFVKGQSGSKPWAEWRRWTWKEYLADVQMTANAFVHLGLKMNGTVAIFGFNSPEWNLSALAAMMVGAKSCGIYPTDTVDQVVYKVGHSSAAIAVVGDNKKLEPFFTTMPGLKAIFMYGETPNKEQILRTGEPLPVYAWSSIPRLSAELSLSSTPFGEGPDPSTPCCLVYTSGTTGMPKAVMLSHDNVCFMARGMLRVSRTRLGVEYGQERALSYLPLSHVAGFQADITIPIALTACTKGFMTVYMSRPYDLKEGSLKDRLTFVRPTVFLGVPRVWEKFHEGLKNAGRRASEMKGMKAMMPIICCVRKSTAAKWSKDQGLRSAKALQSGGSGSTTSCLGLADAMILSKIRAALGLDACKVCLTGAAPIMTETLEAFGSYGLQVNELYGMSESTGYATVSTDEKFLWNSCGFASPGGQVRIFKPNADDSQKRVECPRAQDIYNPTEENQGEICFRGRHIMMGYLANPELGEEHVAEVKKKTAEAIDDDGWMHSGDMGCLGENGFVRITGRYKELIITAGGENVAPVPIEDSMKRLCPALSNVVMIGDKRKFNSCLVTLKTQEEGGTQLHQDAKLVDGVETVSAAKGNAEYLALIQKAIDLTNRDAKACPSNASKVQKFVILPCDFTVDAAELTPTMKVRRNIIQSKYAADIDQLYGEAGEPVTIGRKLDVSTAVVEQPLGDVPSSIVALGEVPASTVAKDAVDVPGAIGDGAGGEETTI